MAEKVCWEGGDDECVVKFGFSRAIHEILLLISLAWPVSKEESSDGSGS